MVNKVTDPLKKVTDPVLISALAKAGIDPDYVEFTQDYAMPAVVNGKKEKGKSPYAKFYRDLKSNKRIMVASGLPMVDADGNKNIAGWDDNGSLQNPRYTEKNNLFKASIDGTKVVIQVKNDQPDGRKQGDKLTYQAQLYLDELEVLPANTDATRLPVDTTNKNYTNNVLEWDYGICKRRLRIVEGRLLGSWVFDSKPSGTIRIKYNQLGDYKLGLGQFKINDNEEQISPEQFDELVSLEGYPVTVNDSSTFYPDADPESTSVDGLVDQGGLSGTWAALVGSPGSVALDSRTSELIYIKAAVTTNQWRELSRIVTLFDTSSLPDGATGISGTVSLYGVSKADELSCTPDINVYSAAPASDTVLAAGDFDSLGSTPFCDTPISYANYKVADPYWNDFVLNAAGIAAISLDGITKFGFRNANRDVAVSTPTWSNNGSALYMYMSEQGAGYKPKLVVTYTSSIDYPISSSVPIGELVGATRQADYPRSASVLIGELVAASRAIAIVRSSSVLVGVLVGATKSRGVTVASSVVIGVAVTASRIVNRVRTSSVLIGELVSAVRTVSINRSSAVLMGVLVGATRTISINRAASVLLGVKVSATRTINSIKSSAVVIGMVVTASRIANYIRTASVYIGELVGVTASRGIRTRLTNNYTGILSINNTAKMGLDQTGKLGLNQIDKLDERQGGKLA